MRSLSDTIARLSAAAERRAVPADDQSSHLRLLRNFGSNPGALSAYVHIPDLLGPNAPLVVVLHGCNQSAAAYDRASGWSGLANEHGFVLLYLEQSRANNVQRCFNWFEPGDTRRGSGENESIRQMIATVAQQHAIDVGRIFITGLSAGGAMTTTMLATHPDLFAGGAIIAGLPHGVAGGMAQAFDRMRGHGIPAPGTLQAALRQASDHNGRWPRLSVWHGGADAIVSPGNMETILAQWRGVHGLSEQASIVDEIDGATRRAWLSEENEVLLEAYLVPGIGHGTPIKTQGRGGYGIAAPYMLDVGISSSARIADFWGLSKASRASPKRRYEPIAEVDRLPVPTEPRRLRGVRMQPAAVPPPSTVAEIIEDALRAAGLMK